MPWQWLQCTLVQHPLRRQKGPNPSPSANNTLATNPEVGVSLLGSGIPASVFYPQGDSSAHLWEPTSLAPENAPLTTSTVQPLEKRVHKEPKYL